jgi:hypothetical protein
MESTSRTDVGHVDFVGSDVRVMSNSGVRGRRRCNHGGCPCDCSITRIVAGQALVRASRRDGLPEARTLPVAVNMSHEHQSGSRGEPGTSRAAGAPGPGPGKRTLTEALGAGEALPDAQRARFERSLGRDLSGVRVHTGDAAADQADRVQARAFATGPHIVFGRGEYGPHDQRSQGLLAHEVAHTAQQPGAAPAGELATTQPGDAAERNADTAAAAMVAGRPAEVSAQPASIARKTKDESVGDAPSAPEAAPDPGAPGAPAASAGDAAPGKASQDGEIGELVAERIGVEPGEAADVGPDVPARNTEAGKQEIAGAGQQLPAQGGAEALAGGAAPAIDAAAGAGGGGAGGEGGAVGAEVSAAIVAAQNDTRDAIAQSEAESAAYKAEMTAQRDQFEAQQHATMLEQLRSMSSVEKRQTLQEMGYDAKAVKKMTDAELDGVIEGKMETEQRKTKILGMSPEELAALSPAQKIQYLVDLGIDRGDLDKAGQAKATKLFDDVMKVAHVPGQHQVKIQIKGGLFGKSWVVKVQCDADGNSDIQAQKEGGFFSKLWGWIKAALPIILTVLGPLTAGASLIALAIYQAATAIKTGDWLGAAIGVAGALVGVGAFLNGIGAASGAFSRIASVASKVKTVAETARTAMDAAKAKNAGSLLGALASGAASFAAFSSNTADKFAQTMTRWSEKLSRWSAIATGGQKVVQGIQKGDPIAAIGGAFDTAAAVAGPKTTTGTALARGSKIAGYANAGKRALAAKPPDYAAVSEAALGIAGQLHEDNRIDDASKIIASASRLKQAWDKRDTDPAGLVDAALGLGQSIQLAKYDVTHSENKGADGKPAPDADRAAITARYERAGRIVKAAGTALKAATAKPRPNYVGALDAATQLISELTASKQVDAAAVVTSKLDAFTRAVNSKNEAAIMEAGLALGKAIGGLRGPITEEHATAKQEAEAQLGPGVTLPDDGADALSPGPDDAAIDAGDIASGEDPDAPDGAQTDGDAAIDGAGGPRQDGDGYTVTPVVYREPGQDGPAKPAVPRQLTISGKVVGGGPLSDAEIDAVNAAAKTVPVQYRRYVAYAGVIKVGGSLSWRANNPGNLRNASSKIDTIPGAVGTFAVFATMDDGRAAQRALYLNTYGSMAVKDAVPKLTPPEENNTALYLEHLKARGVDPDKDVKSQIDILMAAVKLNEGGMTTGVELPRSAGGPALRA